MPSPEEIKVFFAAIATDADEHVAWNLLLCKHIDVNVANEAGRTALHIAARFGKAGMCQALINAGAVVDCEDATGRTPLWDAISHGHLNVARILINAGANVTEPTKCGGTYRQAAALRLPEAVELIDQSLVA